MRIGPNEAAYKQHIAMNFQRLFKQHFDPMSLFYNSCRNFYLAGYKALTRFDLKDTLYEISSLLQPENARKLNPPSLARVFKRFPQLEKSCDKTLAESEWRSHSSLHFLYSALRIVRRFTNCLPTTTGKQCSLLKMLVINHVSLT